MEENEQLIQFIRGSHDRIKEAFSYIEGDNIAASAFVLGELNCLHSTLLECYDGEESETCCAIDEFLKGFKGCQK